MDARDEMLLEALRDITTELRAFRVTLVNAFSAAIQPTMRDEDGHMTREGFLRTEEMDKTDS